jgi:hypothetical protein
VPDPPTLTHDIVAAMPASPQDLAPDTPAWPREIGPDTPALPQEGHPNAPAWLENDQVLEPSTSELLVREVYADELELGGVFAASTPPPAPDSFATDPATASSLAANTWAVPDDAHAFVQEGVDRRRTDDDVDVSLWRRTGEDVDVSLWRRTDEDVDASPAPAAASAAYFTGLEWTTNS